MPHSTAASPQFDTLIRACTAIESCFRNGDGTLATPPTPSIYVAFAARTVPPISLTRYAVHIASRLHQGEAGLLKALALMLRLWKTYNAAPSPTSVHRILITLTSLTMKAHYDDFYVTRYMAKLGGVAARELTSLELALFMQLKGEVLVPDDVVTRLIRNGLSALIVPGRPTGALHDAGIKRQVQFLLEREVRPIGDFDLLLPPLTSLMQGAFDLPPAAMAGDALEQHVVDDLPSFSSGVSETPGKRVPDAGGAPRVSDLAGLSQRSTSASVIRLDASTSSALVDGDSGSFASNSSPSRTASPNRMMRRVQAQQRVASMSLTNDPTYDLLEYLVSERPDATNAAPLGDASVTSVPSEASASPGGLRSYARISGSSLTTTTAALPIGITPAGSATVAVLAARMQRSAA